MTHTHTHTQPFYGFVDFVRDNPGEPVPEETFTHSHSSSSSIIPICFLHLLWSMASSLFNPHTWHSFSTISVQVFFGLPLGLAPFTSYSISSSNYCLHFTANAHTTATCFAVVPRLCHLILASLSTLGILSCSFMPHIQLTIFISAHWSATSFSFLMDQVSLLCNIPVLLCTQLLYNLSLTVNILIGKEWYKLPEFIPSNSFIDEESN